MEGFGIGWSIWGFVEFCGLELPYGLEFGFGLVFYRVQ